MEVLLVSDPEMAEDANQAGPNAPGFSKSTEGKAAQGRDDMEADDEDEDAEEDVEDEEEDEDDESGDDEGEEQGSEADDETEEVSLAAPSSASLYFAQSPPTVNEICTCMCVDV